jgi:hypothetical protein
MKWIVSGVALMLTLNPALACSPAPSCWIEEGGPKSSYLKGICRGYAKDKRTVADIKGFVDEPEKVPEFVTACKNLGVTFKDK